MLIQNGTPKTKKNLRSSATKANRVLPKDRRGASDRRSVLPERKKENHSNTAASGLRSALFYGDNLWVLKEHVQSESVDLIYLDPPFKSNASYNVLFEAPTGEAAAAQTAAFHDTWHWGEQAEIAYDTIISGGGGSAEMLRALRVILSTSDMMAYLTMMAHRLQEMHRVLKGTGTLYLHCDPTASHYLKVVLDSVFGIDKFQAEIIWQRTATHNDAQRWPWLSDTILCYTKSTDFTWNPQYRAQSEEDIAKRYRHVDDEGRRYQLGPMDAPAGGGMAAINKKTGKPNGWYVFKGFQPPSKGWRYSPETMAELDAAGLIHYPADKTKRLRRKLYLDESKGALLGNVWTDIGPLQASSAERIGYPTQKPLALLERIISASSNENDVVLDPFCGCGTTVDAAQRLHRRWIGIDITHYAITVIEDRLKQQFGERVDFTVAGRPVDIDGAHDLARRDKYQFQWWANWLIGVQNYRETRKGADGGIDGIIYFKNGPMGTGRVIVSVKGGENIGPDMVRALSGTVDREGAELGVLITLVEPTARMRQEAAAAGIRKTAHGKLPKIQIATVAELLSNDRPNLPPAYQVEFDEKMSRAGRPRKTPQLEFTFAIQGGKDMTIYPAERLVAQRMKAVS